MLIQVRCRHSQVVVPASWQKNAAPSKCKSVHFQTASRSVRIAIRGALLVVSSTQPGGKQLLLLPEPTGLMRSDLASTQQIVDHHALLVARAAPPSSLLCSLLFGSSCTVTLQAAPCHSIPGSALTLKHALTRFLRGA